MIADVTFENSTFQKAFSRFKAGAGNIADAVGLGAAADYIERVGTENIAHYEYDLLVYAAWAMCTVSGQCLIGTAKDKAGALSFLFDGYRPEDVGSTFHCECISA